MNRRSESEIERIFSKAIEGAVEEIGNSDRILLNCWWPPEFAERMAVQLTQSVALMDESQEEALENTG